MRAYRSKTDVRIWRAPELGAELLHGQFHDFSYDVHTHETACFALITEGAIRIRMRGTEFVARQGDLYAIDADEPHAGWPVDERGWRQRTIYVDTTYLRSLLDDQGASRFSTLNGPIIRDPILASMFQGVHRCSEVKRTSLERDEQYVSFTARLFERYIRAPVAPTEHEHGREPRAIRLALEFLDHHLDQNIHLEDIARAAGLPPFRLFRSFERHIGMTPHAYQRQARIRSSIGLIRLGHPLSEVAATAGFSDQAHLTRCFRKTMGVTPGAYRKALVA